MHHYGYLFYMSEDEDCGVACVKAQEMNVNLSQLVVGAHGP